MIDGFLYISYILSHWFSHESGSPVTHMTAHFHPPPFSSFILICSLPLKEHLGVILSSLSTNSYYTWSLPQFSPIAAAAAAAKLLQSCLTLCDPIDGSPSGYSVPGILRARILEWDATSFSNAWMHAKSLQSYPSFCDPMDSSPPGSSVHRIL